MLARKPRTTDRAPRGAPDRIVSQRALLDFDGRANFDELLLEFLSLGLGNAFLDRLGGTLHEILGLFEAQTRDRSHDLDDLDLLGARCRQDDVKLRLLLDRCA
jgi:hypothetical protein